MINNPLLTIQEAPELTARWGTLNGGTLLQASRDNLVYRFENQQAELFIGRLSISKTFEDVQTEHNLITYLNQAKLPVVKSVQDPFQIEWQSSLYPISVYEYVPHTALHKSETSGEFYAQCARRAGLALSLIHESGQQFLEEQPFTVRRTPTTELESILKHEDNIRDQCRDGQDFMAAVKWAMKFIQTYPVTSPPGILHNDPRPQNTLFSRSGVLRAMIDFDWSCPSPHLTKDVAHAVLEWSLPDKSTVLDRRVFEQFLAGYGREDAVAQDRLIEWMKFSAVSDAASYVHSKMNNLGFQVNSNMYNKYLLLANLHEEHPFLR